MVAEIRSSPWLPQRVMISALLEFDGMIYRIIVYSAVVMSNGIIFEALEIAC